MEDPFASLIKHLKITASQGEKLRTCPFARESEVFPDLSDSLSASPTPASSEPTVIEMVSLPDSVSAENEEFQTPPEHANSSSQPYLSGSEDLRPPPAAAAALGSQSDSPRDKQAAAADEEGAEHQGIVDLGTDCDDLGFSEPRVTNAEVSAPEGSDSLHGNEGCGDDFNDSEFFKGNKDEHASKRIRLSEEDLGVDSPTLYVGETEPTAIEIKDDESVNTDVIDLECEEARENDKTMVNMDSSANAVVVRICEDESSIKGSKRIEDTEEHEVVDSIGNAAKEKEKCNDAANEKGKYDDVASAEVKRNDVANRKEKCDVVGRRELPLSIKGGEKSTRGKEETERRIDSKNRLSFKDIMADVEVLLGKADDGRKPVSLLETAEKCGWVFPKPRWWPPEGFDD